MDIMDWALLPATDGALSAWLRSPQAPPPFLLPHKFKWAVGVEGSPHRITSPNTRVGSWAGLDWTAGCPLGPSLPLQNHPSFITYRPVLKGLTVFLLFPANKSFSPNTPILPVPNIPLLHIPHVASNYFCTSQESHPWIYPLVTPALFPNRVQKSDLHELPFPEEWVWPNTWSPHEPQLQFLPVPTDVFLCRYMSWNHPVVPLTLLRLDSTPTLPSSLTDREAST
ncbi:hypothetical protein N431DRAFT_447756 [Stipitochalara longipes BDJ]|nr:hypothetical protein N431DRAFT_447756 [Stipitochalara longipes BDJ]